MQANLNEKFFDRLRLLGNYSLSIFQKSIIFERVDWVINAVTGSDYGTVDSIGIEPGDE